MAGRLATAAAVKSCQMVLQGLFDAAYFNAVFANVYDQRDELLRTALLLKPGQSCSVFSVMMSQSELLTPCFVETMCPGDMRSA